MFSSLPLESLLPHVTIFRSFGLHVSFSRWTVKLLSWACSRHSAKINTYQKETQSFLSFFCMGSSLGWRYILVPLSWHHVHISFSTALFPHWPWIVVQCEPTLTSYSQLYCSCRRSSLYQPLCRSETRALWDFRRMQFLKGTHYY